MAAVNGVVPEVGRGLERIGNELMNSVNTVEEGSQSHATSVKFWVYCG